MPGGLSTLGLVTIYLPLCDGMGNQLSFGIAEELLKLSVRYGAAGPLPEAWLRDSTIEERKNSGMSWILIRICLLLPQKSFCAKAG